MKSRPNSGHRGDLAGDVSHLDHEAHPLECFDLTEAPGQKIFADLLRSMKHANIDVDEIAYSIVRGLTLTDTLDDDDKMVWQGSDQGFITDETGRQFKYIVRRKVSP